MAKPTTIGASSSSNSGSQSKPSSSAAAAAASRSQEGGEADPTWTSWLTRIDALIEGVVELTKFFYKIQAPCNFKVLRSSLGGRFDETAARALQSLGPSCFDLKINATSPDASELNLVVLETNSAPNGPPKAKKRRRNEFSAPVTNVKDLDSKVGKIKEDLKAKARAVQARCLSKGNGPPPLNDQEAKLQDEARLQYSSSGSGEKISSWPCNEPVTVANFLDYIETRQDDIYKGQIQFVHRLPSREAKLVSWDDPSLSGLVSGSVKAALEARGVTQLYCHQASALAACMSEKKHVIVTTSTASGKSVCYMVPFLEACLKDPQAKALFIFPTKALAQDQLGSIRRFAATAFPSLQVDTYDGDTPKADRKDVRERAGLLLTNPDMLHVSVLPCHAKEWAAFLAKLKFLVLDEAHMYRGAFGCHVSGVVRRLLRLCRHYQGGKLLTQVICCSATIRNPQEHMSNLTGLDQSELAVVDKDGAPMGPKIYCLWNPPLSNEGEAQVESGWEVEEEVPQGKGGVVVRRSSYKDTAALLAELVQKGIRTLVFVKVRYIAELVLSMTRSKLPENLRGRLASYRAGYRPEDRRAVEQGLKSGSLVGVVATNALELGVDIGDLDATLHVGVPGTMSSLFQQAGRAGRSFKPSLSIAIALDSPFDQYVMTNHQEFFDREMEPAAADPSNPVILKDHIRCATFELPMTAPEAEQVFGPAGAQALQELQQDKKATTASSSSSSSSSSPPLKCSDRKSPSASIALRSIDSTSYELRSQSTGQLLETVEADTVFFKVYDGAVYLHKGESWVVQELDVDKKVAWLKRQDVNYFTQTKDHTRVSILGTRYHGTMTLDKDPLPVKWGPVTVSKKVFGYKMRDRRTTRVTDELDLHLPAMEYQTMAVWAELPAGLPKSLFPPEDQQRYDRGGLHAIEHLLISLSPLQLLCEPSDLSCQHTRRDIDPHRFKLLLFETPRGGMGLSQQLVSRYGSLLRSAYQTITKCPCEKGCLSCILLASCYEEPLDKEAAIMILKALMDGTKDD